MNCGDLSPGHVRKWYGFSSSTLGMAFGTPDRKGNAVRGSPRCFNPEIWAGEYYGISVRHYPRFQIAHTEVLRARPSAQSIAWWLLSGSIPLNAIHPITQGI